MNMNTLELDEKLILRMAEGDNDAFRDLYQQTSSAVYGFALSILHALTGMKHREIAELLDLPLGTVMSKYKRSLAKMRKEIEGRGEE